MKIREAMIAVSRNAFVRRKCWEKNVYVLQERECNYLVSQRLNPFVENGKEVTSTEYGKKYELTVHDCLATDWEVYDWDNDVKVFVS